MTEVLSVTDIDLAELDEVGAGQGVCVGQPLAGVGVRIEPLADGDGETGEIVVSAPWLSRRVRRALGDERSRPLVRRGWNGVASHR